MKWIVDMSIYTTMTAALILIIKYLFKSKMSAKWQYYIWVILLIRFMIPSLPQSNFSIFNSTPEINNVIVRQIPIESILSSTKNYITGNINLYNNDVAFTIEKSFADYMIYIWALIATCLFMYFVITYILFSKSILKMRICDDNNVLSILEECKRKVGINTNVNVRIGGEMPMLKGVYKPIIILPRGYTEEEIKDIFLHELCHFKYMDVLVIWLATIILCINWFNPIIWYSFFVIRKDIELVCDQRVIEITQNRKEYANLLLKTALRKNTFVIGTTSIQNGEKEIAKRIKYIAYFKKPKIFWSIVLILVAFTIGGICLTNAISNKKVNSDKSIEKVLLDYKTPYVGDNSKVLGIINNLSIPNGVKGNGIELMTSEIPYGIIINYNVDDNSEIFRDDQVETISFYGNSAIIFSLIENVDYIYVKLDNNGLFYQLEFTREMINEYFKNDVRSFTKTEETFKQFLSKIENIKLKNKLQMQSNSANTFNIYKADDNLTYLYFAGSYFVQNESMTKELPDIIKNEYGINIKKMTLDGSTMIVDMDKSMERELDKGSANAVYKLSVLYKSLLDREGINAVKVLIDGKEGVEGNHYSLKKPAVLESDGRTEIEKYFKIMPRVFTQ